MAEEDRFETAFQPVWRAAYRLVRQGIATPDEVTDKLISSLAKTLRQGKGIPGLQDIYKVIEKRAEQPIGRNGDASDEWTAQIEAFNALDRIVRENNGHRHTRVAADAAKSLLASQASATSDIELGMACFAEEVCVRLLDHYFFAISGQNLVAEGKLRDHQQAKQWQQEISEAARPALMQMAKRLLRNPSACRLRAPNRTAKSLTTSDLLGEALISTRT